MTNPWKRAGAWLGGTVSAVALSPHFEADHLALAATLAGVYRSLDGGRRWQLSSVGLDDLATHALVFAPAGQEGALTAFTATQQGRLYRSLDGGASWEILDSWRYGVVAALAVSPNYPADGTLFVATGEGIFRSFEHGLKWQSAGFGLLDTDVLCLACAPDFAESELLWAGTAAGGFYRSRNAGRAWREAGFGLPDSAVQCLAVSPAFVEDQTLFAGTETAGLFRSLDGGQNWETVGLAGQSINCLALDPHFHAAAPKPGANRTLLAGTSTGILLSDDGGEQWSLAQQGPAGPLSLAMAGGGYAISGSYQEGIAISEDGGRSWQLSLEGLAAHVPPLVLYRPEGPASEAGELIAAAIDSGLVHSRDGGLTWQSYPIDPTEAGTFPAQALAAAGNNCFVATTERLYHSQAGDSDWVELPLPLEGALPNLLAFSPVMATSAQLKGSQKLLLGTQAGQLYLSEAEDIHWRPISRPLAGEGLLLQAAFSFDPAALNLVTAVPVEPQGFKIQLWQSTDESNSWQELVAVSPANTPAAALLIPDPAQSFPLFLAVHHEIIKLVKETSTLAGSRASLPEGLSITVLAASPGYETDQTLFAGTNKGVFHSTDGGESWQPLGQGLEGRAVVALLPASPAGLEAVTLGGEVWRLS